MDNILESINTKRDLIQAVESLDSLLELTHTKDFVLPPIYTSPRKNASWMKDVQKIYKECGQDPTKFREAVEELLDYLRGVKCVNLKMRFYPSQSFSHEVHNLISNNLGNKDFVLDIEVDENLVEGARLSVDGKFINLSLKEHIRNILLTTYAKGRSK